MKDALMVEVVEPCLSCGGRGTVFYTWTKTDHPDTCIQCDGTKSAIGFRPVAPGTQSEWLVRLAKACVRLVTVGDSIPEEGENPERTVERYDAAIVDYQQALAAVRGSAPPAPEAK